MDILFYTSDGILTRVQPKQPLYPEEGDRFIIEDEQWVAYDITYDMDNMTIITYVEKVYQ